MSAGGVVCIHHGNLKIQYRKKKKGICVALKLLTSAKESSRNVGKHLLLEIQQAIIFTEPHVVFLGTFSVL